MKIGNQPAPGHLQLRRVMVYRADSVAYPCKSDGHAVDTASDTGRYSDSILTTQDPSGPDSHIHQHWLPVLKDNVIKAGQIAKECFADWLSREPDRAFVDHGEPLETITEALEIMKPRIRAFDEVPAPGIIFRDELLKTLKVSG